MYSLDAYLAANESNVKRDVLDLYKKINLLALLSLVWVELRAGMRMRTDVNKDQCMTSSLS